MLEAGVEPATNSLGNCCSIQLSYPSDSFPCFLFRSKQERRKISTFTHRCAPAPIAARKRRQRPHKYSERRAQRQGENEVFAPRRSRGRILYYPNTGKGERSERGGKRSFRPTPKLRAHPVLSKYRERRAQRTWGKTKFSPRAETEGASCIIQIQGKASAANVGGNEVFAPRQGRMCRSYP